MFSFGKTIQYRSTFFLNNNQIMLCLRNTGKERLTGEAVLPEGNVCLVRWFYRNSERNVCLERMFCRKGTFALLGGFAGKERLPGEDVLPEGNLCLERTFCRKGTFALLGSFAGKEHLLGKCISEQNSVSATSLNDKSSAKRMSYVVMKKRE